MLKLSTKCWVLTFNAKGSRGLILAVQAGAVKINLAAVEALRKKERQGETLEPRWFSNVHSSLNANVHFCRIFLNLTLCMTNVRVLVLSFADFTDIFNVPPNYRIEKCYQLSDTDFISALAWIWGFHQFLYFALPKNRKILFSHLFCRFDFKQNKFECMRSSHALRGSRNHGVTKSDRQKRCESSQKRCENRIFLKICCIF